MASVPQRITENAISSLLLFFYNLKTSFSVFQVDCQKRKQSPTPPVCKYSSFLYAYRSDQEIVDSVNVTQKFVPKRQLLASKTKKNDTEKTDERRQLKSFEELTDPVAIVRAYERGLFKPRVGWQFRYRVSRYIDHLRENIREDQERLKTGLQAIKRKTPQELSGRRKRVLDKPFSPDRNDLKKAERASTDVRIDHLFPSMDRC